MMALWLDPEELLDEEPESWPADGPVFTDCASCGHAFVGVGDLCPDCQEEYDD